MYNSRGLFYAIIKEYGKLNQRKRVLCLPARTRKLHFLQDTNWSQGGDTVAI